MTNFARFALATLVCLGFSVSGHGFGFFGVAASSPTTSPARAASEIRSALFDAEAALLAKDQERAIAAVDAAGSSLQALFSTHVSPDQRVQDAETILVSAGTAAQSGDSTGLAIAHGLLWSELVGLAYRETMAAATAGDADAAAGWLLLRDFRPTTMFARPNVDATRAVKELREGAIAADDAAAKISADLLDTYQARLEASLDTLAGADPAALSPSQAQSLGLATGYWAILAPGFAQQFSAQERNRADEVFHNLLVAAENGDGPGFSRAIMETVEIVQSFRAAPLSDAELARKSGQLLRYLALVPVEYGRGVKGNEVVLDFEVQEAAAFLNGARDAFAELRLSLRGVDPTTTEFVAATLDSLAAAIDDAAMRRAVADPAAIEADAAAAGEALAAIYPEAWRAQSGDSDFDIVQSLLDQMVAAVAAGQYQQAESSRIEAYAIFETGPEKRLLAFTPTEAQRVERLFWEGDAQTPGLRQLLAARASVADLTQTRDALDRALASAQAALAADTAPAAVVFNAATIVFREGLEAVLILASLLASMIGANQQFKRPLAFGAFAALLVTAVLFVLAQSALLSFGRYSEQLEAIVSVIAIGVLLLVMNWFFHKVYWTRWIAKHHEQRRRLLIGGMAGQALGFAILGFSSVFREGAETVLFLQALVLDAGTGIVVQGTLLGLAATAVVGALTLVLQAKLPHKKMLIVTGIMIAAVLVTMVGSTVHTLQLVGWLPISPIPGAEQLPYWLGAWFGVHGAWQGITAQLLALAIVLGSYFAAERQHIRARRSHIAAMRARSASSAGAVPATHG